MIVAQHSMQYARGGQPLRDQELRFLSCVTAKSGIIHKGAREHHLISS